jgi:hypothetical protein
MRMRIQTTLAPRNNRRMIRHSICLEEPTSQPRRDEAYVESIDSLARRFIAPAPVRGLGSCMLRQVLASITLGRRFRFCARRRVKNLANIEFGHATMVGASTPWPVRHLLEEGIAWVASH